MSKIIAKFSLICWGFFSILSTVIFWAVLIPPKYLAIVSIITGLIILIPVGLNLFLIYRKEGLDFGWFLVVRKGLWRVLLGLTGLGLFTIGLFAQFFPQKFNELSEQNGMIVANLLIILFWFTLVSTFVCWALIAFSEAGGYFRLKNFKWMFGGLALGMLWQLFSLVFSYLFLNVINDIFFKISPSARNWTLVIVFSLTLILGLFMGRFENLKMLAEKDKNQNNNKSSQ